MSYKAYAGAGTVYMAPVDEDGVKTGNFRQVGDAYPLSVQVQTEQIKKLSRMVERAGQVIAARSKISDDGISGSLTLHEWNAANLAWALSGTAVELTTASGSVVDEAVIAPAAGEYIQLGGATPRRNVSNVVVTTDPAGTTYVEGTDFTLDAKLGLITPLAGGGITETDALLVGYDYAAESGYQVDIGSHVTLRVAILANLYDEYRGTYYTLELDSVVLNASQEINFISEADSTGELLQFGMTMETMAGKSSPGRIDGIPM